MGVRNSSHAGGNIFEKAKAASIIITSVTPGNYPALRSPGYSGAMSYKVLLPALALLMASFAAAQKKQTARPVSHPKAPNPPATDELIQKQFGDSCSLIPGPPQFVADLDGDGVDDLVVAARCKNPMADRDEFNFVVADPYHAFFGYGDVKITSTFASDEPEKKGLCLLIIHGDGKDAWRSENPKAKFVLINLPFKDVAVKKLSVKKRNGLGVFMEETGEGDLTSSVVFWDGKKYRYQQLGGMMD